MADFVLLQQRLRLWHFIYFPLATRLRDCDRKYFALRVRQQQSIDTTFLLRTYLIPIPVPQSLLNPCSRKQIFSVSKNKGPRESIAIAFQAISNETAELECCLQCIISRCGQRRPAKSSKAVNRGSHHLAIQQQRVGPQDQAAGGGGEVPRPLPSPSQCFLTHLPDIAVHVRSFSPFTEPLFSHQ